MKFPVGMDYFQGLCYFWGVFPNTTMQYNDFKYVIARPFACFKDCQAKEAKEEARVSWRLGREDFANVEAKAIEMADHSRVY